MKNMTRLMDILDRSIKGPMTEEHEFDLRFVADGIAIVVKKYDIKFDKQRIIQNDDAMIDRVWQAAIEFFEHCGVYNTSTGRRITFTRREIEDVIKSAPAQATIGEGADARIEYHRKVEDPRLPLVVGGPIGTNLNEEMYLPIMQSYIQESVIDTITSGTLMTTHGREPRTKSPLEIVAAWEEVDLLFTATKRAGRPGMAIGAVQMGMSDIGYLSAISRFGFRPCDWHMIAMVGEMKTNNELLNKLAHSVRQDGIIHGFYNPIFGGLAGGEEGLAVIITAGMIALQVVYMAVQHSTCPTHPSIFNDTAPQCIRAVSVSTAAISRNSNIMSTVMTSPVGGPLTDTLLYECIAMATTASACGVTQILGVRSGVGVVPHHCTGLEARFNGEVGIAAAGMSREQANGIVEKAIEKYLPVMTSKPVGKPFWDAYDPVTIKPRQEWLDIYDRVKQEAISWGLPL
jgi:methylamine--corrinoid protein Co-methyltransferase